MTDNPQTVDAGTLIATCPNCDDTIAVEASGDVGECETCGTEAEVVA